MSYYSDFEYQKKEGSRDTWFNTLYYRRWFSHMSGPILDIGCATGNFIANDPQKIEGIDIDADSIHIAKERGYTVQLMDVPTGMVALQSGYYQGIYAKHVIEHLEYPLEFLKQVKRILAVNGTAIISTPNCPYVLDKMFYDDYTHVRPLTKKSLHMLAYDAGFRKFEITEDFRCFPGLGRLMRATKLSPERVQKIEASFGIRGLSLILKVTKQ